MIDFFCFFFFVPPPLIHLFDLAFIAENKKHATVYCYSFCAAFVSFFMFVCRSLAKAEERLAILVQMEVARVSGRPRDEARALRSRSGGTTRC